MSPYFAADVCAETAGKRSDFFGGVSYMLAWDSARAIALLAAIAIRRSKVKHSLVNEPASFLDQLPSADTA
jgi:hypothetical protein